MTDGYWFPDSPASSKKHIKHVMVNILWILLNMFFFDNEMTYKVSV